MLAAGGSYHSIFAAVTRPVNGHERTKYGGILIVPKNILVQGSAYHKHEKIKVVIAEVVLYLEIEKVRCRKDQWRYCVGLGDERGNEDEEGGWICQDKLRQYELEALDDVR